MHMSVSLDTISSNKHGQQLKFAGNDRTIIAEFCLPFLVFPHVLFPSLIPGKSRVGVSGDVNGALSPHSDCSKVHAPTTPFRKETFYRVAQKLDVLFAIGFAKQCFTDT